MLELGANDSVCVIAGEVRLALASGSRGKSREGLADFPVPPLASTTPRGYTKLLRTLKARIQSACLRASRAVNRELLLLYFEIGFHLDRKLTDEKWGTSIIDRASVDLRRAFPEMDGLSPRNLRRMRAFYRTYRPAPESNAIWPPLVAKLDAPNWPAAFESLPWKHHVILMERVKDPSLREFFIAATLEHSWGRRTLVMQIEAKFHARQGKAVTNFRKTLPHPQSELAQEVTRDPYQFGFLSLTKPFVERDIERQLVENVRETLLELGKGFAFIGSQVHLRIHDNDYYLDLLFYHVKLHCFVVIELKEGQFKPEHAGKMNFYLSAVDDLLRTPEDKPTIGLLLCRSKRHLEVEYALRGIDKPMGVGEWQSGLAKCLPKGLASSLPTVEEIEAELRVRKSRVPRARHSRRDA
jgi:predicted nuclease of restriction endonuclease-like (RecB) superfamily